MNENDGLIKVLQEIRDEIRELNKISKLLNIGKNKNKKVK